MGFSARQNIALKRNLDHRYVRTRSANGRELSYIEGWYSISEANRIFGFDGWSRETLDSKCVIGRETRGTYIAVYTAKVRITVHAEGATIVREGHGTGQGQGSSPGEVHDMALKAAETDATKRALATFGKPFGLALYGKAVPASNTISSELAATDQGRSQLKPAPTPQTQPQPLVHLPPDDTTPIPRPSRFYGRRQDVVTRDRAQARRQLAADTSIVPVSPELSPASIDKSALTIAEPRRLRDKAHLRFVASKPCLVCAHQPCDPHHLRFAQPRALGLKVSDEFTVPLCRQHHSELHRNGNELSWWHNLNIKPLPIAKTLWDESRTMIVQKAAQAYTDQTAVNPPQEALTQGTNELPNEAN